MKIYTAKNPDAALVRRYFKCPGCNDWHAFSDSWGYNQNADKPTATPSILVKFGRYVDDKAGGKRYERNCVCHSFITDGRIAFCGDSTHALAGATVDLPDFTDDDFKFFQITPPTLDTE